MLGFGGGIGTEFRDRAPVILNATNGLKGAGAVFDYSDALGDFDTLHPARDTYLTWRLRIKEPIVIPDLQLRVFGHVAR